MISYLRIPYIQFLMSVLAIAGATGINADSMCPHMVMCGEPGDRAAAMEFVFVPEEVRVALLSVQDQIGVTEASQGLWSGLGAGAHIGLKDVVEAVVAQAVAVAEGDAHQVLATYQQSLQDGSSLITVDDAAREGQERRRKHKSFCSVCTNSLNVACDATIGGTLNATNIVTGTIVTTSSTGSSITADDITVNDLTVNNSLTLGGTPLFEPAHAAIYLQQDSNATDNAEFITYPVVPTNLIDDSTPLNIAVVPGVVAPGENTLGFQVENAGTYIVHFWGDSDTSDDFELALGLNDGPIDLDDAAVPAVTTDTGGFAEGFAIVTLEAGDIVRLSLFGGTAIVFDRVSMAIHRIA